MSEERSRQDHREDLNREGPGRSGRRSVNEARLLRTWRHRLGAHGDEFLGCGWVNADGRVELSLGGTAIKRHGEPWMISPAFGADHMASQGLVRVLIDHQFHYGSFVATGERMFERLEIDSINIDLPLLFPRLRLGQPDRAARFGVAEHRRGHV